MPQNFGPLTGIWVALQKAKVLDIPGQSWLQAEYDDYRSSIVQVMRTSTVTIKGSRVVPSYPGADSSEAFEHLWGTVEGVYPFEQLGYDDPLVVGTLRFLQSETIDGLPLHLGYTRGVWPYYAASIAHWLLRLGGYDEAFRIQQAILDYASPTWGWYEEYTRQPLRATSGIPELWPCAECLLLTRELLLLEKGDELVLGPGIPVSWARAGRKVEVENGATRRGRCSYRIEWRESGAHGQIQLADSLWKTLSIKVLPEHVLSCLSRKWSAP